MELLEFKNVLSAIFFILMILSGIWMSRKGKPYNVLLFNFHKLISVATLVMIILIILAWSQVSSLTGSFMVLMILAGLVFVILMITGGLLNVKKETPPALLYTHRISPIILTALLGYIYYKMLYN